MQDGDLLLMRCKLFGPRQSPVDVRGFMYKYLRHSSHYAQAVAVGSMTS